MQKIAIIGAGASGLAAATYLSEYPDRFIVQVFERNEKIAKKVAATGNGHCNLSNDEITAAAYHGDIDGLIPSLQAFDIVDFCRHLGFIVRKKGHLYYPHSEQAKTVTAAFERLIEERGISLFLNTKIISIEKKGRTFALRDAQGNDYTADVVLLCPGGKAAPVFGSDGNGYALLRPFGLKPTPLFPSLVQLKTLPVLKKAKGCRVHGLFRLDCGKKRIAEYKGEMLITDDGISGIAMMQLSRFLDFKSSQAWTLHCNFVDEISRSDVSNYYETHRYDANPYLGIVPDKLAYYLNQERNQHFGDFYSHLSDYTFQITGTRGFEHAQVTKGGIPLNLLDEHLMVRSCPGLYLAGEILNVDGDCGGFNLHFAFASGKIVADHLIEM